MASAATVGSNHNSRAGDGEIVADRGFWPGLMVSLKHNSRFAAFTLIVKGAYPAELDIPLPFSLVSNNASDDELLLMPGYWFRYNMYALARNAVKTTGRDNRLEKPLLIESDWLAPDTVNQMMRARRILETWADKAPLVVGGSYPDGRSLLLAEDKPELFCSEEYQVESGDRRVKVLHAGQAYRDYLDMSLFYSVNTLLKTDSGSALLNLIIAAWAEDTPETETVEHSLEWENVGGQLIQKTDLENLKQRIKTGDISDWNGVHQAYLQLADAYPQAKTHHARQILVNIIREEYPPDNGDARATAAELLNRTERINDFLLDGIRESRRKDYENPFRNLTYDNHHERDAVLGKLEDNDFIREAESGAHQIRLRIKQARLSL